MRITQNLPQFTEKPTLLVATGSHHACVYFALDGAIEKIHELRHDVPTYSDNEGMFKSGTGPGGFGGVLESKKHKAVADLSRELSCIVFDEMNARKIQQIYLFVDPRMKGVLKNDVHKHVSRVTLMTFDGNYVSKSPLMLVSHIADRRMERNRMRVIGRAKVLLDKTRFAALPRR